MQSMAKKFIRKFLTVSLTLYILVFFSHEVYTQSTSPAPSPTQAPAPGPGSSTDAQLDSLPKDLAERIEQLRAAGVSEERIQQFLKENAELLSSQQTSPVPSSTPPPTDPNPEDTETEETPNKEEEEKAGEEQEAIDPEASKQLIELLEQQLLEEEQERLAEEYAQDSIAELRASIFGHHIFSKNFRYFTLEDNFVPPADYILGPGDKLSVAVWGPSELYESLEIAADGSVFRQFLGKIYLGGLPFEQAKRILKSKYRNIAAGGSNIEISLAVGNTARNIAVNVVGYIKKPGTYSVPPQTSALAAIFKSGGLTNKGSVRRILINQNNKTRAEVDLYEYLLQGKEVPFLGNNEFVVIPVQGRVIYINGDVRNPMFYELLPEENLQALIELAGGLNFDARTSQVSLIRFKDGQRELRNFNLMDVLSGKEDLQLQDRDEILIQTQQKELYNFVQIEGQVQYPGNYQLLPGDKISDLLDKAGGLKKEALLKRAYLTRLDKPGKLSYIPIDLEAIVRDRNPAEDQVLQFFDQLMVFSESDFRDKQTIQVQGMVRKPGQYDLVPDMSLKDLLYLAGGLRQNANLDNIELSTLLKADDVNGDLISPDARDSISLLNTLVDSIETETIRRVSIQGNWQDDPTLDTILLNGFKNVQIYSAFDFIYPQFIEVEGAVNEPGNYQVTRTTKLKDMIYRAGGLRKDADVNEIELYRIIDASEKGKFGTLTRKPEIVRIRLDQNWQQSLVADTFEVSPYYKIVIRSEDDFAYKGYAEIKGLVNKPGLYRVVPNMTLKDLLYMAEGMKIEADFENIELSRVIEVVDQNGDIVPVPTLIRRVTSQQDWQLDTLIDKIKINAFDQVFIRKNPKFELQASVFVDGEILVPGEYHKASRSERLSSLVSRAGGPTDLAYLEGAYLKREFIGKISIKLDRALRRPGSKFDISLLEGDSLVIPPRTDVVSVVGNVLKPGTTVFFEPNNKKFLHYVNLSGGFADRTKRRMSTVTYVDGKTKRARNFFGLPYYPKIEQGAVIEVVAKPPKTPKSERTGFKLNIQEVLATATSALTFYLLIDRVIVDGN